MKRFLTVFAVFTLFAAHFCVAQSSVPGSTQDVVRVDSVVVHGTRERSITPTQSFDNQLFNKISAGSVAEVLRFFSGVQIKDYGGIGGLKTVDIHGLGSQHTGVFFDGIAVGNAQNGVVDLGRFSLDNVRTVSLVSGGANSIFLSAKQLASSNSIFFETRRPDFAPGERSRLRAVLKAGSFATVNPSVAWERRFSRAITGSLSAEGLYSSGKYRFRYARRGSWDTIGVRTNGDIRLARVEASLFGDLRRGSGGTGDGSNKAGAGELKNASQKTGEWSAKAYFYASERGYPGAVIKRASGASADVIDRQRDLSFFAQSSVRQRFTPFYSLRAQAKAAIDDTRYNSQRWRQTELYASAANLFTVSGWLEGSLSADIQYNTLSADIRRLTVLTSAAMAVELPHFTAQASVLHTGSHDRNGRNADSDNNGETAYIKTQIVPDKSVFSPSIAASWSVFRSLKLRALFKKSFRLPTFNDLYYNDLGNRALRPEFTTQWSAGLAFSHKKWSANVDGYIDRVRDKIVATPTANQFSWTMLNLGRVEIRGVDVVVESRFQMGLGTISARVAYTIQDASHGDAVPYLPRHSGSFLLTASWREWSASWNTLFTGERYRLGSQTVANLLEPWQTHDLSLTRTIGKAKFTAQVNNIFNRRYEVVRWYPMPGTNVKLIITITL